MSKNKLPVVDTRLRPDTKLYSETSIATSSDVAFLLAKEIQETEGEFVGVLNLNARGQPVSFDIASPETINEHFKEVMTNTVLSNATNFAIVSNLRDWEDARELSIRFGDAGALLDHPLLDHYWVDETGSLNSFLAKQWPLVSTFIYEDHIEVEYGSVNEEERIHNNLMLIEERHFEANDEITRDEAVDLLADDLTYMDRENMCVISLDEEGQPINCGFVSTGTVRHNLASPKELLKIPLLSNASSIIIMHNHPSGTLQPSLDDLHTTALLIDAANMVGIRIDDHIIVGGMTGATYSMRERGDFVRMEENDQRLTKPKSPDFTKMQLPTFTPEPLPEQDAFDRAAKEQLQAERTMEI